MNRETFSSPVHIHTSIIANTDFFILCLKSSTKGLNIGVVFVDKIKIATQNCIVQLCLLLDNVSVVSQVMSLRCQSATSIMRGQRYSECRTPRE